MNDSVVYEKEYFNDNYKEQFEEMRSHYRARTKCALDGRPVDSAPTPNATTVVFLHDGPGGDSVMTTGDFVAYFNRRYGNNDRLGKMRKSLEIASMKAGKSSEFAKRYCAEKARERKGFGFANRVRTAGRKLAFAHVFFALLLVLSVTMLACSTLMLQTVEDDVVVLENEVTAMGDNQGSTVGNTASTDVFPENLTLDGGDSVEIYEVEEASSGVSALLNAIAGLFH